MPPTTGSGAPAATETGPPDIAGYRLAPTPVHQTAQTITFTGRERASRRRVLVTVPRTPSDLAVVQRLRREAGLGRSLRHPNIVGLHPGTVPLGTDALIQEHVPGPSLAERLADPTRGALEWDPACRLAGDVAAALEFARAQGVVHGDVQPADILLPPRGAARLTGFGAEVSDDADARTDVYGLAATVYYALTGTLPAYAFPAAREEGGAGWLYTLSSATPFRAPALTRPDGAPATGASLDAYLISPAERRPDLPPGAADVIRQGLAARPQDRFASAGLFAAALQAAGENRRAPVVVPVVGMTRLLRPAAIASALALLAGGVWIGVGESKRPGAPYRSKPAPPQSTLATPARPRTPRLARVLPLTRVAPLDTMPPQNDDRSEPTFVPSPRPIGRGRQPRLAKATGKGRPSGNVGKGHQAQLAGRPLSAIGRGRRPRRAQTAVRPRTKSRALVPPVPALSADAAWLRISARQVVNASSSRPLTADVRPERVLLDDRPLPALTRGDWVRVAPGPHHLAFYPPTGGPFAPNVNLHVSLEARSRRHVQVPLPRRVAEDTVVGGLAHFPPPNGIMTLGPEGGPARGDDTDDTSPASPRHAPARRGGR